MLYAQKLFSVNGVFFFFAPCASVVWTFSALGLLLQGGTNIGEVQDGGGMQLDCLFQHVIKGFC